MTLADYEFLVITLFRSPISVVWRHARRILHKRVPSELFRFEDAPLDLSRVYERCPPAGGAHDRRAVFFEPASSPDTTAFIANLADGWMTLCNVISGQVPGEQLRLRSAPKQEYPIHDFDLVSGGESLRYVRAMRDGPRWEFYADGEPCEFEDLTNYRRRRIRDRLNRDILVEYTKRLGWDLTEPRFWKTTRPAHYVFENVALRQTESDSD